MPQTNPTSLTQRNSYTLVFMVILSLVCAIILSTLASALSKPQELAKELDRSRQMLIAARIMSPAGYFQVIDDQGKYVPAKFEKGAVLSQTEQILIPDQKQILEVYKARIEPLLVDDKGNPITFEKAGIDEQKYIQEYRKTGYYRQPLKLMYKIYSNAKTEKLKTDQEQPVEGYVIPVNGIGLFDAIYGYLAIKTDGDTVIGISWYDQKETPGLGANISEPQWQSKFPGKLIFQQSATGKTDFKTAQLGIIVNKGKVSEVLGNSPKAKSAVDGMAGATLTGNGVTNAYHDVLSAYRPFLIILHEKFEKTKKTGGPL